MPEIHFRPGLNPSQLTDHSREVLEHLLDASANPECLITRMGATPRQQAEIMRANCLRDLAEQRRLYRGPGQRVIDVFVADGAKSAEGTILDMEAEIIRQGPANVSHHCCDPAVLQVLDVSRESLIRPDGFEQLAGGHAVGVSKCLDENGCVHLEIPQPSGLECA